MSDDIEASGGEVKHTGAAIEAVQGDQPVLTQAGRHSLQCEVVP